MKLRSSIKTTLMRRVLFRGTFIASLGTIFIMLAGIFLPLGLMTKWGWCILIVGLGLITYGLLPYKKLTFLEKNPSELVIENEKLHYIIKGKLLLSLPLSDIEKWKYVEIKERYGIAIWLKKEYAKKIKITSSSRSSCFQWDIFFPFFSQRAFRNLQDYIPD